MDKLHTILIVVIIVLTGIVLTLINYSQQLSQQNTYYWCSIVFLANGNNHVYNSTTINNFDICIGNKVVNYNSTKYFVSIYNANLYKPDLNIYKYVDTKELNTKEHLLGGNMEWKNLRVTVLGPRKGSVLTLDIIWELAHVLFDNATP